MKLGDIELRNVKKRVDKGDTDVYQLVVPILLPNKLLTNYKKKLFKKGFEQEDISNEDTLELQYLNVVQDTYTNAFEYYKKKLDSDAKFIINFASPQIESYSKSTNINELEFDLIKYQVIFNEYEIKESKLNTTIYIVLTCSIAKTEKQLKSVHYINFLISSISTLDVIFNASNKIKNSQIINKNETIQFIHGSSADEINTQRKYIPRIQYVFDLFDIVDEKFQEKTYMKINYPLGMNCYLNYYAVLDVDAYSEFSYIVNNPTMDLTKESDCNACTNGEGEKSFNECNQIRKFCKGKYNRYLSVLNKFNTSKLTNIYVDDVEKLTDKLVCKNFMTRGTMYMTGERSFGAIVKTRGDVSENKIGFGVEKQVFSSYAPAIFFSLNHKVLNISIQEQLKGIKENKYDTLVKYHLRIEKYVFYEVTAESHLQLLFEKMQIQHNNYRLFEQINNEIEIHQTRELNKLFQRLTNVGIYLAVAALVISIPSYLATYDGVGFDELNDIEKLLTYPTTTLFLTILCIIITYIVLEKRR